MERIDVTFRESALCDAIIEVGDAIKTIKQLAGTGIDYIEIGYLKANLKSYPLMNYSPSYIGNCYRVTQGKTKLAAMMHPEDFSPHIYDEEIIRKLALIRITANPGNFHLTKDIVAHFKPIGPNVSINLVRSSRFTDEQTCEYCERATQFGADYFYIADSNGHLLPGQVRSKITALKKSSNGIKIGFHAHDNLGLSVINALEAVQSGADIIDGSLLGHGKGAGNLRTEIFPLVLGRSGHNVSIDEVYRLLKVTQYFYHNVLVPNSLEEQHKFAVYGRYDIGLDMDKEIFEIAESENMEAHELAFRLIKQSDGDLTELRRLLEIYRLNTLQKAM